MKRAIIATIVLITPLLSLSAKAAGDVTQGKAHYAICQTCHGENGGATWPRTPRASRVSMRGICCVS